MGETMYVRKVILCCLLLSLIGCKKNQTPVIGSRFENATSFILYDIDPRTENIPIKKIKDVIQNIDKEEYDLNLFKRIVKNAKYQNDNVFWKGSKLGIVTLSDGSKIYLAVSVYGSFFEILGDEKGLYVIKDNEGGTEWKNEYRKHSIKLIERRRGKENN